MRNIPGAVRLLLTATVLAASSAHGQTIDRARQLFDAGEHAAAKRELIAIHQARRDDAESAYLLGRIALIENDGDEAVRRLERAVELDGSKAAYHAWLGNAIREVTPRAGKIRMALNARRMRREWERALQLDPDQIDARAGLIQFYAMAPGVMGGSMDKARAQAAEIARRNAMRGALARGLIAEVEGNVAAEEATYRQAVIAAPDSSAGYFALANMLARTGRGDDAFAVLVRYAERRPDDRWVLYYTGRVAGVSGLQPDRGERALNQFLASPSVDANVVFLAGAHYWLGQIASKREMKDVAREHYRTALTINPYSPAKRALEEMK
ncbi:MAG: tetratricopeptide repeat protein [Gemmatimonadota bacterium]